MMNESIDPSASRDACHVAILKEWGNKPAIDVSAQCSMLYAARRLMERAGEVGNLRAENARLRERLEMGWATDANGNRVPIQDGYDGIYARDETIRLQDEQIDRLRAWKAKHVEARAKGEARLRKLKRKLRRERTRVAAAYQIVGGLAHLTDTFDAPDVQRALDYLSGREIEGPILPWPRTGPTSALTTWASLRA